MPTKLHNTPEATYDRGYTRGYTVAVKLHPELLGRTTPEEWLHRETTTYGAYAKGFTDGFNDGVSDRLSELEKLL